MGRFELLEKEINKGIQIDEKSGTQIDNWSPNNVRRLLIGYNYAIVQYFCTGGKYARLVEVVEFNHASGKDLEQVQTDPQKYRPILQVLTKGRVISSIEEIYFLTQGYPNYLLSLDTNLAKLESGNTTLENRFPRLRHVSLVNLDAKEAYTFANQTKEAGTLLLTVIEEKGIQIRNVLEQHQEDWWSGTALRPKHYSMDATKLKAYFEDIRADYLNLQKQEKLDELNSERYTALANKSNASFKAILDMIATLQQKSDQVFQNTSIISKAEWSNVLQLQSQYKGVAKELKAQDLEHKRTQQSLPKEEQTDSPMQKYRRIDFELIAKTLSEYANAQDTADKVTALKDQVFTEILKEDEYRRDSNKATLNDSYKGFENLAGKLLNIQVNIVYLALAKYLTRNKPENAQFFFNQLPQGVLTNTTFTRTVVQYCNKYIEEGWTKKAFDNVQFQEVKVEDFTIKVKYTSALQILGALSKVR